MDPGKSHFVCRHIVKKTNLIKLQDSRLRHLSAPAPPRQSRRIQIQNPNRTLFDPDKVHKLKEFSVRANGMYVFEEDSEEEEEDRARLECQSTGAAKTIAQRNLAQRRYIKIREGCKKYRKVYRGIQPREQKERVQDLIKIRFLCFCK